MTELKLPLRISKEIAAYPPRHERTFLTHSDGRVIVQCLFVGEPETTPQCESELNEIIAAVNTSAALKEENKALRSALTDTFRWMGKGKDSHETSEDIADWFHEETGFLAPYKDEPALTSYAGQQEKRQAAWDAWCVTKKGRILDAAKTALGGEGAG